MAGELSFEGRGLPPEDEILARVVVDLGLAKPADVEGACGLVETARAAGSSKSLADAMQETGALHPRFVSAVTKAVKSRLASRKGSGAGGTRRPAASAGKPRTGGVIPRPASAPARPTSPAPAAASPPSPPPPPAAGQPAPVSPPPAAPEAPGARLLTPRTPDMHRQENDLKDVHIPEAAIYKRAPKGEGFSVRSKTDIASAWAAHKKGGPEPAPKQPLAEARAKPENRLANLIGQIDSETAAEGEPPPQRAPVNPLERLMRSKSGGRAKPPPRSGQPGAPGRGKGGVVKQSTEERKPFTPAKRRFAPSGITQSIDVDDLRAELGIGSKPQGQEEATPSQAKQKAIALQAFIKRVIRTTLHQQCLEIVLRQRLTLLTPSRLAQEAACRDKEARRVLGDWKSGGLIVPRGEEYGEPEYDFSPSRADLATIKDYMTLWDNPEWHNKLLGWIIQEEGTR